MRKLVFLDATRNDLREIASFVRKRARNGTRGAAFAKRLADKCVEMASVTTMLGRQRPEFGHDLRSMPYLNYLIFFRYAANRIEVVAITHSARDLATAFSERNSPDEL